MMRIMPMINMIITYHQKNWD